MDLIKGFTFSKYKNNLKVLEQDYACTLLNNSDARSLSFMFVLDLALQDKNASDHQPRFTKAGHYKAFNPAGHILISGQQNQSEKYGVWRYYNYSTCTIKEVNHTDDETNKNI